MRTPARVIGARRTFPAVSTPPLSAVGTTDGGRQHALEELPIHQAQAPCLNRRDHRLEREMPRLPAAIDLEQATAPGVGVVRSEAWPVAAGLS
jgi:hypothetical protein